MSQLRLLDLPADRMEGEVVAAFYFTDQRPVQGAAALLDWRLEDPLTSALVGGSSRGRGGEHLLIRSNGKLGSDWVLFAGGDEWQGLDPGAYRRLIDQLLQTCSQAGFRRIALCLTPLPGMSAGELEALARESLAGLANPGCECLLSLEGV